MKLNNKILSIMLLGATAFTGLSITSCVDEPDKYEIAGGTPSIDRADASNVLLVNTRVIML